ncbi:tumor necrosis factor ligand superfamily member 11 [Spea bombifrons]|uniref:tumor necrosis factor ligand superfamily member 11 n=1 Tax=Spea bombifrons TaxID=233779 RepID=UPI00234BCD2A|nr:tumor necrosis factor ligand superfamily member 11 [Spea bombifrons]
MSPGGYLRGAEELRALESPDRSHTLPRSVLFALIFLAVAQVGCTLGLFLYFKAQMDPGWISNQLPDDKQKLLLFEQLKQKFSAAGQKDVPDMVSEKQVHVGNAVIDASNTLRDSNPQKWPVAHLTIANVTTTDDTKVNLTSWYYKEGWANLQNMSYNNGKLKVLQDGFYFIYANICFRHHKGSKKALGDKALQLLMYICKTNKNRRPFQTLMKGGNTEVWSRNSVYNFYSVYQGGVFKLLAGEEIFIQASYSQLLDVAPEATYFGAFKILDLHV